MTDRDLLELAAKAAGFIYKTVDNVLYVQRKRNPKDDWYGWNPLDDDGDALRLAVKLKLCIAPQYLSTYAEVATRSPEGTFGMIYRDHSNDPFVATRRAIVLAAAEIGRLM